MADLGPHNPFPGLRPFALEDSDWLFGRDRHVARLRQKLTTRRFLAVVGRSGDGKSSLVTAGLRPVLEAERDAAGARVWLHEEMRPQGAPIEELAHLVDRLAVDADPALAKFDADMRVQRNAAMLTRSSDGLVTLLQGVTRARPGAAILIVVDQFEELFRFIQRDGDEGEAVDAEMLPRLDEATAFVDLLLNAAQSSECRVHVALTMRSDFLGDCTHFPGLAEAINDSQFLVPRLTRSERKSVIVKAVEKAGGWIDPTLVQRLLNDTGEASDMLPVLQHTLMRLWREASARGTPARIELRDYETVGEVRNALSNHADTVLLDLSVPARRAAEIAFRALVEVDVEGRRTRRTPPPRFGALVALNGGDEGTMRKALDGFRAQNVHILRPALPAPLTPETTVDISHEAVIRRWRTLGGWVDAEAEDARMWRNLMANAEDGVTMLPKGTLDWHKIRQPTPDWAARYPDRRGENRFTAVSALIDESIVLRREQARKQRTTKLALFGAVSAVVVALLTGVVAWTTHEARKIADEERFVAQEALSKAADELTKRVEAEDAAQRETAKRLLAQQAERTKTVLLQVEEVLTQQANPARAAAALEQVFISDDYPVTARAEELTYRVLTTAFWQSEKARELSTLNTRGVLWRSGGLSPDGRYSVQLHPDHRVIIQDIKTGDEHAVLIGHDGFINSAIFSPDGSAILTASGDGTARLWDPATGKERAVLSGHDRAINSAVFSPDGDTILTASSDDTAILWEPSTAEQRTIIEGHEQSVRSAVFSPDGTTILTASSDKTAVIWTIEGERKITLEGHEGPINSAVFDSTGATILTASVDGTARLWNSETGEQRAVLNGHDGPVWSAVFSPDGEHILTSSWDSTARLWDAKSGGQIAVLGASGEGEELENAVYIADGDTIRVTSFDGTIWLWDAATFALRASFTSAAQYTSVRFSEGGQRLDVVEQNGTTWSEYKKTLHDPGPRMVARDALPWLTALNDLPQAPGIVPETRSTRGGQVLVVRDDAGIPAEFAVEGMGEIRAIRRAPGSSLVLVLADRLTLWRLPVLEQGEDPGASILSSPIARLHRVGQGIPLDAAFGPDGTTVAVLHSEIREDEKSASAGTSVILWPVFETQDAMRDALESAELPTLLPAERCGFALDSEEDCARAATQE